MYFTKKYKGIQTGINPMLKNINPNLNAKLLHVLCSMGHGDELVLTDCNFPSDSVTAETVTGKFIQMDGLDIPELAKAI